ncbi:MAG: hypothetical protein WCF03_08670 [Nitrososphaeraceae archaeon]
MDNDNPVHPTLSQPLKRESEDGFILYTAAAGDLPNEKVPNCHTCKKQGHPHEAVTFEKVNGRLCNDGTYEAAYWKLRDYFTGRPHQHKQQRRSE